MLVLSRKVGDTIWINEDIELVITEVKGEQIKIGIRAPKNVTIVRGELRQDVSAANAEAVLPDINILKK